MCEKGFTKRTGDPTRVVRISILVDVTVYSHSGHPTWGCIPRGWGRVLTSGIRRRGAPWEDTKSMGMVSRNAKVSHGGTAENINTVTSPSALRIIIATVNTFLWDRQNSFCFCETGKICHLREVMRLDSCWNRHATLLQQASVAWSRTASRSCLGDDAGCSDAASERGSTASRTAGRLVALAGDVAPG